MDSSSRRFEHILFLAGEPGSKQIGASLGPKTCYLIAKEIPLPSFLKTPFTFLDYTLLPPPLDEEVPYAFSDFKKIAFPIYKTAKQLAGKKLIIFSGDHSLSIAHLPGLASIYQECGLIWIDAHADLHTPTTSPSKNIHGMSLGFLLHRKDQQHPEWNELLNTLLPNPLFSPEKTAIIGLRSYEHEEMAYILKTGLSIYSSEDSRLVDPYSFSQRLLKQINGIPFFISFDIDSIDAKSVPGTGTPVQNGLSFEWAANLLYYLMNDPKCIGVEITEFNPLLDEGQKTQHLIRELLMMLFPM